MREIAVQENVLIYVSGRNRYGKYCCGFLNDSTPPCLGHYRINLTEGKSYTLEEAQNILKDISGQPGAVVIFKPIWPPIQPSHKRRGPPSFGRPPRLRRGFLFWIEIPIETPVRFAHLW